MATALIDAMVCPCTTAVRFAVERPPSNSTISTSRQRSAKKPRSRATYGGVWTTVGGVTDPPTFTFLGCVQAAGALPCCAEAPACWAGAAPGAAGPGFAALGVAAGPEQAASRMATTTSGTVRGPRMADSPD